MSRWSRARVCGLAASVVSLCILAAAPASVGATELLPNLDMLAPRQIQLDSTSMPGHNLLRYTTILINKASYDPSAGRYGGPFEVLGRRASSSDTTMSVTQRVQQTGGTYVDYPIPGAVMYYATEDGHHHWHVKDMETGALHRLDNGVKVGAVAKMGYCFYDNFQWNLSLPGAPQTPVFKGCGNNTSMSIDTGLSIGWGDRYKYNIGLQYIDITGIAAGSYRLRISANPAPGFRESNTSDNASCGTLQIADGGSSVTVVSTTGNCT
jgi:hypothetical protein